jgi:peroxiredoxin
MVRSEDPLRELPSSTGQTLDQLSNQQPQLVVFLRHFGCTFCRESLADLSHYRDEIESGGHGITLVHMVDDDEAQEFFSAYGLGDVPRISDPDCCLYRMFGLDKGGLRQLFGLRVWIRGLIAGVFAGHWIGSARGNPFQMPGVYVFEHGRLVTGFQHHQASDRPDYMMLIRKASLTRTGQEVAQHSFDPSLNPVSTV